MSKNQTFTINVKGTRDLIFGTGQDIKYGISRGSLTFLHSHQSFNNFSIVILVQQQHLKCTRVFSSRGIIFLLIIVFVFSFVVSFCSLQIFCFLEKFLVIGSLLLSCLLFINSFYILYLMAQKVCCQMVLIQCCLWIIGLVVYLIDRLVFLFHLVFFLGVLAKDFCISSYMLSLFL